MMEDRAKPETKSELKRRRDASNMVVKDLEELEECSDGYSEDGCGSACYEGECDNDTLLANDLREEHQVVADIWSPMHPRLITHKNRCDNCVELINADLMCHGKEDGGFHRYIVVVLKDRGENFLWHMLEIVLWSDTVDTSKPDTTDDASWRHTPNV